MRQGPHPLLVHLGIIAANMSDIPGMKAQKRFSVSDAEHLVHGIQMYQSHPYKRPNLPCEKVWQHGVTTLLKPLINDKTVKGDGAPLLLVPSLINKSYIFDLKEEKSLFRWLSNQGISVHLLDWGDICKEENLDVTDLIETKLNGAIIHLSEQYNRPVNILGYCMGGVLTLGAMHYASDILGRVVLLASPFDFHDPKAKLYRDVRLLEPSTIMQAHQMGHLPASWIQSAFAGLDPDGAAKKFIDFADMDQGGKEAELFVSVEDWLNDGVDLPVNIAQHCIQNWFRDNVISKNDWFLGGENVDLQRLDYEILIIASQKDRIVPSTCAFAAQNVLRNSKINTLELDCGHISMMVGRRAAEQVWFPILEWFR